MKKYLFIFIMVISFFNIKLIYCQSIKNIETQIDSLEKVKLKLENEIKSINEKIVLLKKERQVIEFENINKSTITIKTKSETWLLTEPSNISEKIVKIPASTLMELVGYELSFCKVIYNGEIGYIWDIYVEKSLPLDTYKKYIDEQKKEKAEKEIAKQRKEKEKLLAERKRMLINKYGSVNAQKIIEKKIWLNMTKEMTIESWGNPNDINRTVNSLGVHEQWIYGNTYLYFDNGKLTSWQD